MNRTLKSWLQVAETISPSGLALTPRGELTCKSLKFCVFIQEQQSIESDFESWAQNPGFSSYYVNQKQKTNIEGNYFFFTVFKDNAGEVRSAR